MPKILFECTIPGKVVSKKNSRPIWQNKTTGRPFLGKSGALREAEALYEEALGYQYRGEPIDQKVRLHCVIYYHRRTVKWPNKLPMDLIGGLEFIQDCLEKAGVIADDALIHGYTEETRMEYDKENPRCEIKILEL